jgi:hypothetical protein
MIDLIWDLVQQGQISSAESSASTAQSRADAASKQADRNTARTDEVEQRVERLALLCQAMWELLSERCQVTKNDLVHKVVEVDLRDGRENGRMDTRVVTCPRCNNNVSSRRPKCIVCGTVVVTKHPFDV